ncbi:deoxyribodipyrimidine photo-lyase [Thiomicrospira sp. ALE5]|uniref:cryptochrome/photolyase family protein n=1 Tax=Thiomicrospira sp. ALE5 TaxID=748650 RepID=UPI0008E215FD|nr:deoxyribodipyrimidine photo-lyase [Thiomicrospira sp. ALE5]SFR62777.1 deoxyribodipyrimidine photo-lyase [Thiomicrospira sp. ALE5]
MRQLIWFQRDLRLQDHAPIHRALSNGGACLFGYIHDPALAQGEANQAWLVKSLESLQQDLQEKGANLLVAEGPFDHEFERILIKHKITDVLYHFELGEPYQTAQQHALRICKQHQVRLTPFDQTWLSPETILTQQGKPYGVYTPFSKKVMSQLDDVPKAEGQANWSQLKTIELEPKDTRPPQTLQKISSASWAQRMLKHWHIGEQAAWSLAKQFLTDKMTQYPNQRDFPGVSGTSQLSTHLHFGEISSTALLEQCRDALVNRPAHGDAIQSFIRQLIWREFARYLLFFNPKLQTHAYQEKFNHLDWPEPNESVMAWQKGVTGIPIIDAGMRQLWQTGWMHNRVRMLVASWLTKNLNQHWLIGQRWFEQTLIDADIPNNVMGWQWVAGCGVDAAPYFRLFNPVVQSEKFDPQGVYIRKWLPELTPLPTNILHAPWEAANSIKQQFPDIAAHYPLADPNLKQARLNHQQRVQQLKTMTLAL